MVPAVAVVPGRPHSAELRSVPLEEPGPGQVRVATLAVGVCGTDAEIDAGGYGTAPGGDGYLVLGHESLLRVETVGPGVSGWAAGDLAVGIVRRPCPQRCPPCAVGRWDLCETGDYRERGIRGLHGFLRPALAVEADFLVRVPAELAPVAVLTEPLSVVEKAVDVAFRLQAARFDWRPRRAAVLGAGPVGLLAALLLLGRGLDVSVLDRRPAGSLKARLAVAAGARYLDDGEAPLEKAGPFDLIVEATGYAPLAFRAMRCLGPNGALALTGVTSGRRTLQVDANAVNQETVLENHVIFGSVNASRAHYAMAIEDLGAWVRRWGDLVGRLITGRHALPDFRAAFDRSPDDVKRVIEVAGEVAGA
jgi:threonine dehydrogenase-like Zn-dependent dehydrogenase